MKYTIKELADLAGVTTRTLRWYDSTGLLKPAGVTEAGYRRYGPAQVERLQQILFYRELGLELAAIGGLLDDPGFDRMGALRSHLAALAERRVRLDQLILTVQKTIDSEKGDVIMSDQEKFAAFKQGALAENEARYGAEIRAAYGGETVEQSSRKFEKITKEEYDSMTALGEEIRTGLEQSVKAGADPGGEAGGRLAGLHKKWLGYTWPSYSAEAHRSLAQMYVDDPRFTAHYDREVSGCAAFLRAAVLAHIR